MKNITTISIILALVLLTAPLLVAIPNVHAAGVYYSVNPVAIAPLTDINANPQILETPATPSPVGQYFNVDIVLNGATVANVPAGVAGIEVHFDFSTILGNASLIGFQTMIGQPGGVFAGTPGPSLLYTLNGVYDSLSQFVASPPGNATQYQVAVASTGSPWLGASGLIAILEFQINNQPSGVLMQPNYVLPMDITFGSAVDGTANGITLDAPAQGTLQIDASPYSYPAAPSVYITPASFTGDTTIGDPVTYTVMITSDVFWDVAGFDIQVTWNSSLLTLATETPGTFLGADIYGFWINTTGAAEGVYTKLDDLSPSGGTGSLMILGFTEASVGNSYPPASCPIAISIIDLASWAHPERIIAPWNGTITAVDLFPFPGATVTNGLYTEGIIIPGPNIDLYDQYPSPFGGQGANQHSDSFAPQAEVCLYAKVTYGGDRVTNKLVLFEIDNAQGQKLTLLSNYSDANGIASVCFRIPQTDLIVGGEDPSIFGWWNVIATVELDQVTVNDTMAFQVGWLAQVNSVTANNAPYLKYTQMMNFSIVLSTIHEQPFNVTVSIDSYDTEGYPIGETLFTMTINATRNTCPFTGPLTTTTGGVYNLGPYIQPIPTWARVGTASVIGYTLTALPRFGGTADGPQSPATPFAILLS